MDDKGSPKTSAHGGGHGGDDVDTSGTGRRFTDREPGTRPVASDGGITTSGSGRRPPRPLSTTGGGGMRVMTRGGDANLPVPDVTQVPAESGSGADHKPAKRKIVSVEARHEEAQAAEDLALRRPALLERIIERLPDESPVRQLLVAVADSFFSQLVVGLIGTVMLVIALHAMDPTARFAGPFLYLYFLGAALYFARFKPHQSLIAASGLCVTGFLMFTISTGTTPNIKPLLAFKPTALFWLSTCLVSAIATSLHNRHVEDLLERRVALLALQRQIREKEEQSGRAERTDKMEENFNIAKNATDLRKAEVSKYSAIFMQMQRLSRNLAPDELFQTIWEILKHSMQAQEVQVYVLRGGALEGVAQFKSLTEEKEKEAKGSFADAMARSPEVVPRDQFQHPFIPVGPENPGIFSFIVDKKRNLFSDDIKRDRMLEQLSAKSPLPVAFCFPLVDAKSNTIKGLVNVSAIKVPDVDDEMRKMVRAVADVSAMAMTHWEALEEERGKKLELKKLFSTLVSPTIVQQLMDNPGLAEPRRQKITVVFVDLRGFTNISEANSPAVVVELLTHFFGRLTPLIFKFDGTLDKYIGDEIMALWGAPASSPLDARKAVLASWEMREAFAEVQEAWAKRLGKPPNIGIAVNTGEAMVGLIGSESQRNYTAIGDAVNTAARLEGCTGAGKIYITRSTYDEVNGMCELVQQPSVRVQGKAEPLEMWEVVAIHPDRLEMMPQVAAAAPVARIASSRDIARQIQGGAPSSGDIVTGAIPQPGRVPDVTSIPGAPPPSRVPDVTHIPGAPPRGNDVTAMPTGRLAAPGPQSSAQPGGSPGAPVFQRRTNTVPALQGVAGQPAAAQAAAPQQAAPQSAPHQASQPAPPPANQVPAPSSAEAAQMLATQRAIEAQRAARAAAAAAANNPTAPGQAPAVAARAAASPLRTTGGHTPPTQTGGGLGVSVGQEMNSSAHGAGAPQVQPQRAAPVPTPGATARVAAPGAVPRAAVPGAPPSGPVTRPAAPSTSAPGALNPRKPDQGGGA